MATMVPCNVGRDSFHGSIGESRVYWSLKNNLPDDIYILHSINWREFDGVSEERNGEADFLLFDPHRGFLSIEVKSGGIRHDSNGDWWSIDRNNQRHKLRISPLEQAKESVQVFKSRIKAENLEIARPYQIKPVVWFTSIDNENIHYAYGEDFTPGNTFSADDLDDPMAALSRAYTNYGLDLLDIDLSTDDIQAILSIFKNEFNIVATVNLNEHKYNKDIFNRLTTEQATILNCIEDIKQARIKGAGGTGKTMLALELVRRIDKDKSILFLCFNKFLLNALRKKYSASFPNVRFANLNELYAERTGLGEIADKADIIDFLNTTFREDFPYENIIIDEGQDFDIEYLDIIKDIASKIPGYFYIFYDENQLVHQWNNKNIEWFNNSALTPLKLNRNCRNTMRIAETSYRPINIDGVVLAKDAKGEMPILRVAQSDKGALEIIENTIRGYLEKGLDLKQIVILTVKTITKSLLRDKTEIGDFQISIDDPDGDGILFTTSRKYKGLESDVVIIIDIDRDCFKDDNAKSVFYVAASRAINCLSMVATLDDYDMNKILEDINVTGYATPKEGLEEALSVKIIGHNNNAPEREGSDESISTIDFIERARQSSYNKCITNMLLAHYLNRSAKTSPIPTDDINEYLRNVINFDNHNVSNAIMEALKWPFYSNRVALEFCILYYMSINGGYDASSMSDLLGRFVIRPNLSSIDDVEIVGFLESRLTFGAITLDSSGTLNHYILSEE